jgi:hypothetical protein
MTNMHRIAVGIFGVAMLIAWGTPVQAGTKVQGSMVPTGPGTTYFLLDGKPGKFAIKASKKAGDGGSVLQLKLKGVDCDANGNNDGGKAGKCSETGHTMVFWSNFSGIVTVTPILYDLDGGKSIFPSSGKNKVTAADSFGPIASAIQGNSLGVGFIEARGPGSDTSGGACDPPILPGDPLTYPAGASKTTCIDGELYAIGGIVGGTDPGSGCSTDSECTDTQVCVSSVCTTETCNADAGCRCFGLPGGCSGSGGAVACDEDGGTCCLTSTGGTCDID